MDPSQSEYLGTVSHGQANRTREEIGTHIDAIRSRLRQAVATKVDVFILMVPVRFGGIPGWKTYFFHPKHVGGETFPPPEMISFAAFHVEDEATARTLRGEILDGWKGVQAREREEWFGFPLV